MKFWKLSNDCVFTILVLPYLLTYLSTLKLIVILRSETSKFLCIKVQNENILSRRFHGHLCSSFWQTSKGIFVPSFLSSLQNQRKNCLQRHSKYYQFFNDFVKMGGKLDCFWDISALKSHLKNFLNTCKIHDCRRKLGECHCTAQFIFRHWNTLLLAWILPVAYFI